MYLVDDPAVLNHSLRADKHVVNPLHDESDRRVRDERHSQAHLHQRLGGRQPVACGNAAINARGEQRLEREAGTSASQRRRGIYDVF